MGNTAGEIRNSINQQRVATIGQAFDAYVRWQVQWTYQYDQGDNSCTIAPESLRVGLTGRITMPEWNAPAGSDPQLVQRWQTYITRLRAHEDQHIQHGREAAQSVRATLPTLEAATCGQLETLADNKGLAITRRHAQKDKEYDRTTNHGRNEGIQFP